MSVYYNEFDPGLAAWLRQLIKNGGIANLKQEQQEQQEFKQLLERKMKNKNLKQLLDRGIPEDLNRQIMEEFELMEHREALLNYRLKRLLGSTSKEIRIKQNET